MRRFVSEGAQVLIADIREDAIAALTAEIDGTLDQASHLEEAETFIRREAEETS